MIRIGMLGADSSHTEAYAELMNLPNSPFYGRGQVVKLWGADAEQAEQKAAACAIPQVCATPAAASNGVDLIMIVARYGDDHAALANIALAAQKPIFIDKPLTNDLAEARAWQQAADGVPFFSCSPLRYAQEIASLDLAAWQTGSIAGLSAYPSLGKRAENIFFYGIHLVELLLQIFGRGVVAVRRDAGTSADSGLVRYADGRLVGLNFLRDCREIYSVSVFTAEQAIHIDIDAWGNFYARTLDQILTFAETQTPPFSTDEMVEAIQILDGLARADDQWVFL